MPIEQEAQGSFDLEPHGATVLVEAGGPSTTILRAPETTKPMPYRSWVRALSLAMLVVAFVVAFFVARSVGQDDGVLVIHDAAGGTMSLDGATVDGPMHVSLADSVAAAPPPAPVWWAIVFPTSSGAGETQLAPTALFQLSP